MDTKIAIEKGTFGFAAFAIYSGVTHGKWVSKDGALTIGSLPEDQRPDLSQNETHKHDGVRWKLATIQEFMLDGTISKSDPAEQSNVTENKVEYVGLNLVQRIVLIIGALLLLFALLFTEREISRNRSPLFIEARSKNGFLRCGVLTVVTTAICLAVGKRREKHTRYFPEQPPMLRAWQRSYSSITHLLVDKGLPDKWLVRIDGQSVAGFHRLRDVYRMQRADPHMRFEIRIAEPDGTLLPESPWIEVYDDAGFLGKIATVVKGLFEHGA